MKEGVGLRKEQFDITGMTCSACSARVEKSVAKLYYGDFILFRAVLSHFSVCVWRDWDLFFCIWDEIQP